jgi:GDP-mannose 6-dehydrogenase
MKRISVFGLGYVGAVTAACFARAGHQVLGVDVNPHKVEILDSGRAPVLEPGLEQIIAQSREDSRLRGTTSHALAVSESEISFVCVGTPSLPNGQLDLSSVKLTCEQIGAALREKTEFHWVVLRSTMLPGTAGSLAIPTLEVASGKRAGVDFAVCVNPEFTREGSAVADFSNSITVLGADDPAHLQPLRELYHDISGPILEASLEVAEMVKYACNAFHALKVTFANEIGTLCRRLDVDGQAVMKVFMADTSLNISTAYLTPGFAFGGSCLPKDLRALTYCAKQFDLNTPLLQAITISNQAHLDRAVDTVLAMNRRKIAVLGLSFKAGTDDLRESPSVQLVKRLLGEGRQIQIWDHDVSLGRIAGSNRQFIEEQIPHIGALLSADLEGVIANAELVVVIAKTVDTERLLSLRRPGQIIIDLRSPVVPMNVQRGAEYVTAPANSSGAWVPLLQFEPAIF